MKKITIYKKIFVVVHIISIIFYMGRYVKKNNLDTIFLLQIDIGNVLQMIDMSTFGTPLFSITFQQCICIT